MLSSEVVPSCWSKRVATTIGELRQQFAWLRNGCTTIQSMGDHLMWWTFAGSQANAALAAALRNMELAVTDYDNLSITLGAATQLPDLDARLQTMRCQKPEEFGLPVSQDIIEQLKFSSCLPHEMAVAMLYQFQFKMMASRFRSFLIGNDLRMLATRRFELELVLESRLMDKRALNAGLAR